MSNPESFIEEVTEEVRRDRLFRLMRRYGWIAIVLVFAIVGGAAFNEWRKARDRAAAEAFGDTVLSAMQADDSAARLAALETIEAEGGRGAILALLSAAEAVAVEDKAAALALMDRVAADGTLPESYRQLALLKRVLLAGSEMALADRQAALEGLARPGGAFRSLALEQQALLMIEAGDSEAAIAHLRALMEEPEVTPGLLRRVGQLIVSLGAEPIAR